jgi:5-methylcytosine-specific restriction protein A
MDLVAEAGIDVSAWGFKQDPTDPARTVPVARPRANPKFCYEWAFGDDSQGYVLCVWHSELKAADLPDGPAVVYSENVRELALSLDRIKIDNRRSAAERNRARDQARRAVAFDLALQRAFRKHQPVRLIINEGDRRPEEELGTSKSTVEFRHLDPVPWTVRAYDEKGLPLLVRGFFGGDEDHPGEPSVDVAPEVIPTTVPDAPHAAESPRTPVQQAFVDQFSDLEPAASREFVVSVRERSAAVRERVLRRAAGACELCGRPGFRTLAGAVYLETHHVIPLAEDGPDHETNVLALCPDDHRRAHYAHDRESRCWTPVPGSPHSHRRARAWA